MATTRLLRTSRPLRLGLPSTSSPSSLSGTTVRCVSTAAGFNGEKTVSRDRERKPTVAVKASLAASESLTITSKPQVNRGLLDLASLLANASLAAVFLLRLAVQLKPRKFYVQMFLERAIIDCRFFTLIAVAGSLLGSVLCFVEGSFIILESYLQYFYTTLSQKMDQEHMVHLLIEAIDMFLVGTAMLTFGVGLYVMFVGIRSMKEKGPWLSGSNLFGLFSMKTLPTWAEMQSVSQAKSKIGHAVMMILQVGVLEKLKSVNLVTAVDLACFAGAVLMSSASIFLLSRLSAD